MNFVAWQTLDVLPSDKLDLSTSFLNCRDWDYSLSKYQGWLLCLDCCTHSLCHLWCSTSLSHGGPARVETPERLTREYLVAVIIGFELILKEIRMKSLLGSIMYGS